METKNKDYQPTTLNNDCPYCGERTPITTPDNFKSFYAHCVCCKEKFVVEPIRDGIKVYTTRGVPYGIDPDCQDLEMGQSDEE